RGHVVDVRARGERVACHVPPSVYTPVDGRSRNVAVEEPAPRTREVQHGIEVVLVYSDKGQARRVAGLVSDGCGEWRVDLRGVINDDLRARHPEVVSGQLQCMRAAVEGNRDGGPGADRTQNRPGIDVEVVIGNLGRIARGRAARFPCATVPSPPEAIQERDSGDN